MEFTVSDRDELCFAKSIVENPRFAARIANIVGVPMERAIKFLPRSWNRFITRATRKSLLKALQFATYGMKDTDKKGSYDRLHKTATVGLGAAGGAVGFWALPIELPATTLIILRSIADIARSEGHDLAQPGIQLSCLEVFALGGPRANDDGVEGGYWAIRSALEASLTKAATWISEYGLVEGVGEKSAPHLVRFVTNIAPRYGVVVTEQAAAKAIPLIGAASGATINLLFMNHFQSMAKAHFIIKRLEATYGTERVKEEYGKCDT